MATGVVKSSLSTESPPFNPSGGGNNNRGMGMGGMGVYGGGGQDYIHSHNQGGGHRSRSTSPYPPQAPQQQRSSSQQQLRYQQQQQHQQQAQQQPPQHANSNAVPKYTFEHGGKTLEIRNVWNDNVEEEMELIRSTIEQYPFVAMDTEFPGIVAKPVTESYTSDYHYKSLKCNVDLLKIIQLGLSFSKKPNPKKKKNGSGDNDDDENEDEDPTCLTCWQFNFKFDLDDDMFAQDSIDLLVNSGISFVDHATRGISPSIFGELLMVSGLVLDDRVKWVSFHSGYDFAYLLKILTSEQNLPKDEKSFFELLKIYFPTIYDIKYMTSLLDGHQFLGGLQRLADDLGCQRLGAEHQAGSDSLLTMSTFFALRRAKFTKSDGTTIVDDKRYKNELFGYGQNHTVRNSRNAAAAAASAAAAAGSGVGVGGGNNASSTHMREISLGSTGSSE